MKIKITNILLFILTFIAAIGVTNGVDAKVDKNSIYAVKTVKELENNITEMTVLIDDLKSDLENKKKNTVEYDDSDYDYKLASLKSQIEELKFFNGFTDVRGPGIYLSVSDSLNEDESVDIMEKIVHDVDITVLLNDLRAAGAEAIEVNAKRITNLSEVVCAGPLLKINGEVVPAPFIIRAIGDPEELYEAVTAEGTYAYDLKNKFDMEVFARMSYYLIIPKFTDYNYGLNFAESIDITE